MTPPAVVQALPPGVVSLADHQSHARRVLDPAPWAYLDGGAGDEHAVRDNRAAWDALRIWPRVLQPLAGGHTRVRLLGRTLAHPILLAPVAYQRLAHADGEMASALAASAQEAGFVLGTQSSVRLESIADAVRGDTQRGPLWFQLYCQPDRGTTRDLVRRAEAAGFEALVLTVDAPVHGVRDSQRRAGFRLPPDITAVNLPPPSPGAEGGILQQAGRSATWADVEWLRAETRLPVLLKGVLRASDARRAVAAGAAGVIVSNHGGRTLDSAPATADALPAIVNAIAGLVPVLVDGGIRRGTDVLKAMALGASAVLIGRPIAWGLATAGALGVAHVIRLLRDELEIAMALAGCATLEAATPELLHGD